MTACGGSGGGAPDAAAELMERGWVRLRPEAMLITGDGATAQSPNERSFTVTAVLSTVLLVALSICGFVVAISSDAEFGIRISLLIIAFVPLVFLVLGCHVVRHDYMVSTDLDY
ncbi:hypothetical protein ACP4OV_012180 [Aristida adscensionis]